MRLATLKKFVRLPKFDEHLALHRMDCLSSNRNLEAYEYVQGFLRTTPPEEVRPTKLVTGQDVLRLGVEPGPVVGEVLSAVEEAQLNGEVSTREDAMAYVADRVRRIVPGFGSR